jgi:solute carrier family 25 protein 39/40
VTPIDVVKVRLQSQGQPLAKGECFLFSNGLMDHLCMSCSEPAPSSTKCEWYNRPGHFNGTIDAFIKITRNEGGKLYKII